MNTDDTLNDALALHRAGRLAEAVAIYEAILAVDDDHAGAWLNLGSAQRQSGDIAKAVASLRRAADLAPDHPGVLFNLGNALAENDNLREAERSLRRASEIDPAFTDAFNNLADVLLRLDRNVEALEILKAGLKAVPDHLGMLINRGNAEHRLGDIGNAVRHFRRALDLVPGDTRAMRNLGNAMRTSGDLVAAEQALRAALSQGPDDTETHCVLAFTLLAQGQFGAGWREYRWRWQSPEHEPARPFRARWPEWDGFDSPGRHLLVWGEQAVGDELMFATMLPDIARLNLRVTFETEHRLQPLFQRSFPQWSVIARRTPADPIVERGAFDAQIALGDLGHLLRPDEAAFAGGAAYLRADAEEVDRFRTAYQDRAGPRRRVGLAWKSGAEQAGTPRSVPLDALVPLLRRDDCWFVNLQYGDVADELAHLEQAYGVTVFNDPNVDQMNDLDSFAAQVASLDLVISSANTTVHMAGALGVPVWVMLSHHHDWRWMQGRENSPWYPSVRLFRQSDPGAWPDMVERLAAELAAT